MLASIRAASLVAALLALTDVGSGHPGPPSEPLQPRDYASSSGDWVLHVDPSQRYGAGPARCRMTHAGVVAWERELAFSFQLARVTNDGNAIGYAITAGIPFQRLDGDLVVAILAPDGRTRREEHETIVFDPWALMHSCLASGQPTYPLPQSLDLVDADDRAVLIVNNATGYGLEVWEYRLSTGEPLGRKGDAPDAHPVRPYRSNPPVEPKEFSSQGLAEVALVLHGETRFELPETVASRDQFRFWQIDSLGRVLLFARESVAVFRRSGELVFVAQPDPVPPGRSELSWPSWAAARGDGGLSLRYLDAAVDCGPDGRQVRCDWSDALFYAPWRYYLPASPEWWEIDNHRGRITRLDASGQALHVIERDANQRWLHGLYQTVVARDGSLAALDYHAESGPWLQIFDADARPVASTELRSSRWTGLAFDGRRAALLRDSELVLVDARGTPTARATLPGTTAPDGLVFSPEGELWAFEGNVAQRYAVP